jgi:hypothetical protein
MNPDAVIAEWNEREEFHRELIAEEETRRRAEHYQACMDYDDAREAVQSSQERPLRCTVGFHRSRWNPRWKRGCDGFCTICGADTGGFDNSYAGY